MRSDADYERQENVCDNSPMITLSDKHVLLTLLKLLIKYETRDMSRHHELTYLQVLVGQQGLDIKFNTFCSSICRMTILFRGRLSVF